MNTDLFSNGKYNIDLSRINKDTYPNCMDETCVCGEPFTPSYLQTKMFIQFPVPTAYPSNNYYTQYECPRCKELYCFNECLSSLTPFVGNFKKAKRLKQVERLFGRAS